MPLRSIPRERKASVFGGAGSGLGIVTIAHSLPPGEFDWAKGVLEYLAPIASIAVAFAWAYVLSQYKRRQIMQRLEEAVAIRDRVFSNRASSKETRARVQSNLERVQSLVSQLLVAEAEDLAGIDVSLPVSSAATSVSPENLSVNP
jgi:hypothetical protein